MWWIKHKYTFLQKNNSFIVNNWLALIFYNMVCCNNNLTNLKLLKILRNTRSKLPSTTFLLFLFVQSCSINGWNDLCSGLIFLINPLILYIMFCKLLSFLIHLYRLHQRNIGTFSYIFLEVCTTFLRLDGKHLWTSVIPYISVGSQSVFWQYSSSSLVCLFWSHSSFHLAVLRSLCCWKGSLCSLALLNVLAFSFIHCSFHPYRFLNILRTVK